MSSLESIGSAIGEFVASGALIGFMVAIVKVSVSILFPIIQASRIRMATLERDGRGPYTKEMIKSALTNYIRQSYSELPLTYTEDGNEVACEVKDKARDFFKKMDNLLDDNKSRVYILILGGSGAGKTTLLLNYFSHNLNRGMFRRKNIVMLNFLSGDASRIGEIKDHSGTDLFIDGIEGDKLLYDDFVNRFNYLMTQCCRFRSVTVAIKTHFLLKDEEFTDTGIPVIGSRQLGDECFYKFNKLYLIPFDEHKVERYIKKRFPVWRSDARNEAIKMAKIDWSLSQNPLILNYISELAASKEMRDKKMRNSTSCEFYKSIIFAWLKREAEGDDPEELLRLSENLAVNIYNNSWKRRTEGVSVKEIEELAQEWQVCIKLRAIGGKSLLNRDAQGVYRFAHRSIMEFLYIVRVLRGDRDCFNVPLSNKMKRLLIELVGLYSSEIKELRKLILPVTLVVDDYDSEDLSACNLRKTNSLFSSAEFSSGELYELLKNYSAVDDFCINFPFGERECKGEFTLSEGDRVDVIIKEVVVEGEGGENPLSLKSKKPQAIKIELLKGGELLLQEEVNVGSESTMPKLHQSIKIEHKHSCFNVFLPGSLAGFKIHYEARLFVRKYGLNLLRSLNALNSRFDQFGVFLEPTSSDLDEFTMRLDFARLQSLVVVAELLRSDFEEKVSLG